MHITIDPKVKELESAITKVNNFRTNVYFEKDGRIVEICMTKDIQLSYFRLQLYQSIAMYNSAYSEHRAARLTEALDKIVEWLPDVVYHPDTVCVSVSGSNPDPDSELSKLTRDVFSIYFKNIAPSLSEKCRQNPEFAKKMVLGKNLEAVLQGTINIDSWNQRSQSEKASASWEGCQLANKSLTGIDFSDLVFSNSNFDGSDLSKAKLVFFRGDQATFRGCKLEKTNFDYAKLNGADFTGANMKGAKLSHSELCGANLTNANLSKANLKECDLRGVDLTVCTIDGAQFDKAEYDQTTKLPPDFKEIALMHWKGEGANPYDALCRQAIDETSLTRFEELIPYLRAHFDKPRINKVIKMLKAESFQLFAEVPADHVLGVVKSQTDEDLVYSCVLRTDGNYWCCTQNLRPCGGLKGSLCKHLLVLTIGLAKAGQFDLSKAAQWVLRSKIHEKKPKLDKEMATSIFLKYKGAEASEVDWRPTETIPEDYHSF